MSRLSYFFRQPLFAEIILLILSVYIIASVLGVKYLLSSTLPTGGDMASHILYAWLYSDQLLFSGNITAYMPEVFGGFAFLSYYFPLPFIVVSLLSQGVSFSIAFKWGVFLGAMLLPVLIMYGSRRWLRMPLLPAICAGFAGLAFLLHEQNSIWGGNLLSILSGEFAYSYSLLFAVLSSLAWIKAIHDGKGWLTASLLEAACGFSHGFPLLVVGVSSFFLLADAVDRRTGLAQLIKGHLLAFCLLGGWLWPLLEMHALTIPNDGAYIYSSWREFIPVMLWPVAIMGLLGLALHALPSVRVNTTSLEYLAIRHFFSVALLAGVGFFAAGRLGLADIRFFPIVLLFLAIICGWLIGRALFVLSSNLLAKWFATCGMLLGLFAWIGSNVSVATEWGFWNFSGLEAKPQWRNLGELFPDMKGNLWTPRLLFEHDPDNEDIGSTRALEALPMFLGQRPVLEGLFMESALMGPAIYYLQSEVSARPSSPLVRFPSGQLDPEMAAKHMNFLHVNDVLLRSEAAKKEMINSGLFRLVNERPPFALLRLNDFSSSLIMPITVPIQIRPEKNWMQDAFVWFKSRHEFMRYLPVYSKNIVEISSGHSEVKVLAQSFKRHQINFETSLPGKPLLIKMAFHPRWQLLTKGSLYLAGPGFMLVVPEEKQVKLIYGSTLIDNLGQLASIFSLIWIAVYLIYSCYRNYKLPYGFILYPMRQSKVRFTWFVWLLLLIVGAYFYTQNSERHFKDAVDYFRRHDYHSAAISYRYAFDLRSSLAGKEESLFWLAKSKELDGDHAEARRYYKYLFQNFHGYWIAESLYSYAILARKLERFSEAIKAEERLKTEFPASPWAQELLSPNQLHLAK